MQARNEARTVNEKIERTRQQKRTSNRTKSVNIGYRWLMVINMSK